MKVLVYGDKTFIRRFTGQKINGIEVTGISDTIELTGQLAAGEADIILVNGLKDDASANCERIKGSCQIPIALLVNEKKTKWNQIDCFAVDGFIPEQATGDELKARLQAIWRRSEYYVNRGQKPVL